MQIGGVGQDGTRYTYPATHGVLESDIDTGSGSLGYEPPATFLSESQ